MIIDNTEIGPKCGFSKEDTKTTQENIVVNKLPIYEYVHCCNKCGRCIKTEKSHKFNPLTSGSGFCSNCGEEVETKIKMNRIEMPEPKYSKDNPYTGK